MTTTISNTNINEAENKIPDTTSLVTTNVLNTKTGEVENKIPDHAKYITSLEFNRLIVENFAARLKQASLVTKADFDNKLTSFNKRITSDKTKHLAVQKTLNSPITKGYNFFLDRIYFTSDDGSQNMFVYQLTFNVLELKNDKGTKYIISCKSIGIYNSKVIALHGAFLPNMKYFRNKIGIHFNSTPFVIEQNNCTTKIVNVYIVYDLDNWPKTPLRNFT